MVLIMLKHSHIKSLYWRRCSCLILLLSALPCSVTVQAASEDAGVFAEVVSTLNLVNQADMVFGDIAASNSPGTVILSTGGTRLTTGGTFVSSTVSSGPAVFDVFGLPNSVYAITLPDFVALTGASGNSMVVDNFTSQPVSNGLTNPGGEQNLVVGATLNVNSHQAIGSYSGTMTVTIVYN
jgi:hypothetical protein